VVGRIELHVEPPVDQHRPQFLLDALCVDAGGPPDVDGPHRDTARPVDSRRRQESLCVRQRRAAGPHEVTGAVSKAEVANPVAESACPRESRREHLDAARDRLRLVGRELVVCSREFEDVHARTDAATMMILSDEHPPGCSSGKSEPRTFIRLKYVI
jgi:hypothetical protein